ncbi:MAG: GNAT family N-acetyltransferase [Clostridia bacterium]|nr:GNAT family N-acetyltransferase [Clostridia bacterium]
MHLYYAIPEDIDNWMRLVTRVRRNFPGLETDSGLLDYRSMVLKFMGKRQAICVKADNEIVGVMLFSRGHNMICCLAVSQDYRRRGAASALMDEALKNLDRTREISVSTFRAEDEKGRAPRALYEKYGFIPSELIMEMGYPNQKYVLFPEGCEGKARQMAVNCMVRAISEILAPCAPSIYMYGSSVMEDFRLGWSDIDLVVLTEKEINENQAGALLHLRQDLLKENPGNPYYRLFEGGMLSMDMFLKNRPGCAVYWGTSGERICNHYTLDAFCRTQVRESGVHLYGKDIREQIERPAFSELIEGVRRHHETIRDFAHTTGRSLYTFGWMLDIARCICTLRTGKIISKTKAAEWAIENHLCADEEALLYALMVRKNPLHAKADPSVFDFAETLIEPIHRFNESLGKEIQRVLQWGKGFS